MKIDATAAKYVQGICEGALVKSGFRRLSRDVIAWELAEGFLGWIGLNMGRHADFIRVNPFAGVHCVPVMKLVADVSGERYQRGRYATVSKHLGELCPDVPVFDFSSMDIVESEADRLAVTYQRCGVPFMKELASYETLLPALEKRVPTLGGYPQRVAATLQLMGRTEDAIRFVEDQRAEYESDPSVQANFDRFALPFLKMFGKE